MKRYVKRVLREARAMEFITIRIKFSIFQNEIRESDGRGVSVYTTVANKIPTRAVSHHVRIKNR